MSILNLPRIYFSGGTSWNVATANNNDQWPTYDFPNARLNWDYLASQEVDGEPITPENYKTTFPQWVLTMQTYVGDNGDGTTTSWQQTPAEWNYWGGNTSQFIQSTTGTTTTVNAGQLDYGAPVSTDPLIGLPIQILSNNPPNGGPRLVDINPDAYWTSQIYLGGIQIGDATLGLTAQVQANVRMYSRWLNFQRNLNTDGKVEIAGVGGCIFQIGLLTETVQINNPNNQSALLSALQDALDNDVDAIGIQLRFAAYLTKYWSSEEILSADPSLVDCLDLPSKHPTGDTTFENQMMTCQYQKLQALWDQGLKSNNPAITVVDGTLGVWNRNEPSTVPWQRYLPAEINGSYLAEGGAPNPLGPASAYINAAASVLSLDFSNVIPETDSTGAVKFDVGDILVTIINNGTTYSIATLAYTDYNKAAYGLTSGIIDIDIPQGIPLEGRVVLQAQKKKLYRNDSIANGDDYVVAIAEAEDQLVVQTDQRGVYIEQDQQVTIGFDVIYNGTGPKNKTVNILIAQYLPFPAPPAANAASWELVGTGDPVRTAAVAFATTSNGNQTFLTTVTLNDEGFGSGTFTVTAIQPGFPNLMLFPYDLSASQPVPPDMVDPVAPDFTILNAFFSCLRVMPFDDLLPLDFAALWNQSHDSDTVYDFLDDTVFATYALIYPIMAGIVGSKDSLINNNTKIQELTNVDLAADTAYMPITRELSNGKREVIEMWGTLVDNGFDPLFNFPLVK